MIPSEVDFSLTGPWMRLRPESQEAEYILNWPFLLPLQGPGLLFRPFLSNFPTPLVSSTGFPPITPDWVSQFLVGARESSWSA